LVAADSMNYGVKLLLFELEELIENQRKTYQRTGDSEIKL
jgi:hypothetical protein